MLYRFRCLLYFIIFVFSISFLFSCVKAHDPLTVKFVNSLPTSSQSSSDDESNYEDGEGDEGENSQSSNESNQSAELVISPLTLNFSNEEKTSPANMKLLHEVVKEGATITPNIKGEWRWISDNTLVFKPEVDWTPNTEYTVQLLPMIFNPEIKQMTRSYNFKSEPFAVKDRVSNVSIFPNEGAKVRFTAEVVFSYEIDKAVFEKVAKLNVDGKPLPFKVDYDKYGVKATITSEPIAILENNQKIVFDAKGTAPLRKNSSGVLINDLRIAGVVKNLQDFFKIETMNATVVKNDDNVPQQVIMVTLTDEVDRTELAKYVEVYSVADENLYQNNCKLDKVAVSQKDFKNVKFELLESSPLIYPFLVDLREDQCVYFKAKKGFKSKLGFTFSKEYSSSFRAPKYHREVFIVGDGSVLPISSDKVLTIGSRGNKALSVRVGRVLDDQVQHLILLTSSGGLGATDIYGTLDINSFIDSRQSEIPLAKSSPKETEYYGLDLNKYMSTPGKTSAGRNRVGLFYLSTYGCINSIKCDGSSTERVNRLILLTDIAIIMKVDRKDSRYIFASSISSGAPLANARVEIVGKNGLTVYEGKTNLDGYFEYPALKLYNEKTPVAVFVSNGSDISYIPLVNGYSRNVNYSNFDVGGDYLSEYDDKGIKAYLFSDRGIYRPGETVNLSGIVKQMDWKDLSGVPVELQVFDPNAKRIYSQRFSLTKYGLFTKSMSTKTTFPTGLYSYELYYVNNKGSVTDTLASASFKIDEFEPDTMKVDVKVTGKTPEGWQKPSKVEGYIKVENLFGSPATKRRVRWTADLIPTSFSFDGFSGYNFTDPLSDPSSRVVNKELSIDDTITNDDGVSRAPLQLANFISGTYRLRLSAEAFAGDSGDSVISGDFAMVSPLDYIVGYKTSVNLSYVPLASKAVVEFVALNNEVKKIELKNLTLRHISYKRVQSMVRSAGEGYRYQTVLKPTTISSIKFTIEANGNLYQLPADKAGMYAIEVVDEAEKVVSKVEYMVAGESNLTGASVGSETLKVTLNKKQYNPGETAEMNIVSPYAGYGLITIERDKLYNYKWFKMTSTSSVQKVVIPESFEGNAYVNVSLVRAVDSKEVFISPHSYAVVPFNVSLDKRKIGIELSVKNIVEPGETVEVKFKTDKDAAIVLYGVDEGILQVARYRTPDPLSYFFTKKALQVTTAQTVDLILPNYSIIKKYFSVGGGEDAMDIIAAGLNPFARKLATPAIFFSELMTVKAGEEQVYKYTVPSTFNGRVRVMAVAANEAMMGTSEKYFLSKSQIVITPSVPPAALKNDEFDLPVNIVNNMTDTAPIESIKITAKVSGNLELIGANSFDIDVPKNLEGRVVFRVKVKDEISAATVTFTATTAKLKTPVEISNSISIRPSVPHINQVDIGIFKTTDITIKDNLRDLYNDFSSRSISVSSSPFVAMKALNSYLQDYSYICTEQLVSKAYPKILGYTDDTSENTETIFISFLNQLRERQSSDGGFSLWPRGSSSPFVSLYVASFLNDAAAADLPVPRDDIKANLMRYLSNFALSEPANLDDARLHAAAIYEMTRSGIITTKHILAVEDYLNTKHSKAWKKDLTAAYIGASYIMMKDSSGKGLELIKNVEFPEAKYTSYSDYDDSITRESQYIKIVSVHAKQLLKDMTPMVDRIFRYIADDHFTTLSSAMAISAFLPMSKASADDKVEISEINKTGKKTTLKVTQQPYPNATFSNALTSLEIKLNQLSNGLAFYYINQRGYDKSARKTTSNGIEIRKEYLNSKGEKIAAAKIGDTVTVRVTLRSITGKVYNNVVVTDLLPTGFEVDRASVQSSRFDYYDIREDRVLLFLTVSGGTTEISFRAKLLTAGTFTAPAIYAEAMYNRSVSANTEEGRFTVDKANKAETAK